MTMTNYHALDWNALWHEAKRRKPWKAKKEEDWNQRAASFAKRTANSVYVSAFIEKLAPESDWSLLDVGSGPGTLALPLAERVRTVTCLDFSTGMLDILRQRMADSGCANIHLHCLAWEDDWNQAGLEPHDVAIASRSMAVSDLRQSLEKLTRMARRKIVVTDKVRHGPFDPDAFAAVGRPLETGPDYIYTVNLLYQLGHHPCVDYIQLEEVMTYESIEDALTSYRWMFRDLSANEEKRLRAYLQSITTTAGGGIHLHRRRPPVWAFISWQP